MTSEQIREALIAHFKETPFIAERALCPKRETWFSAESLVALMRRGLLEYPKHRLYGEETYGTLASHVPTVLEEDDVRRSPDLSIVADLTNGSKTMLLIGEVKLVTDKPEDLDQLDDTENALATQLERARRLYPQAQVLGIIFVITSDAFRASRLVGGQNEGFDNLEASQESENMAISRELRETPTRKELRQIGAEMKEAGMSVDPGWIRPKASGRVDAPSTLSEADDRHRTVCEEIGSRLKVASRGWRWVTDGVTTIIPVEGTKTTYAQKRASLGLGIIEVPHVRDGIS